MGIDNDAELILGWQVDTKKACKWLRNRGANSCSEDYQCFCADLCWKRIDVGLLPEFTFKQCSPYYDCPEDRCKVMFCLKMESCEIQELSTKINLVDWKEAEKFAHELGAEGTATIWAEPHVW